MDILSRQRFKRSMFCFGKMDKKKGQNSRLTNKFRKHEDGSQREETLKWE